jgi:hypothetical protein
MIRSHTFRGRRYNIRWVPRLKGSDGIDKYSDCDVGVGKKPTIRYSQYMFKRNPEEFFEKAFHEAIHACLQDLDEESVTATAEDVTRYMRREGYHRDK